MGYKFKCQKCGDEIVVKYCLIGDSLVCKSCERLVIVPDNAEEIEVDPWYFYKSKKCRIEIAPKERQEVISEEEIFITTKQFGYWRLLTFLGELFRVYGKNVLRLVIVPVIFYAFAFIIILPFSISIAVISLSKGLENFFILILTIVFIIILLPLMDCAFVFIIAKQYVAKSFSIGSAFRTAFRNFGPAVAVFFLRGITFIFLSITIIGIPFAFDLFISWSFSYHIIIIEKIRNPFDAFRRSSELIGGFWWRTFGMICLFNSVRAIPNYIISRIPASEFLGLILFYPISIIGTTLLYFDLRVRKEGLTPEQLAQELGMVVKNDSMSQ